ncbi:MAG: 2-succinyl-5-enolpyruvyl-6-hydroxy-3-cyclohexene-1-carboxylic-acid synthase [Bacteroidota bacterium]|nr:2-succinyl-5-enolpyruvyl-6-hydroxy-3-cyclohexene-1-carboxylic-acid synthase [Bacteroidota bacterium]
MHSDKKGIRLLVAICKAKGLTDIIISPGSRNASLVIEFTRDKAFRCLVVPDERSAAFVALGMAQQSGRPAAVICTSGTAPLNYSPAMAEAYYQRIPLVAITADRPAEWIGQADGQAILQHEMYKNFVRRSVTLPQEPSAEEDFWYLQRMVSETLDIAMGPVKGPVHINVPMREPLYRQEKAEEQTVKLSSSLSIHSVLSDEVIRKLAGEWNGCRRKMMLCGGLIPENSIQELLPKLNIDPSLIILTESISNLALDHSVACIDRVLAAISKSEENAFTPDLLITFGGPVVSKKVKALIRRHKPVRHWHIDPDELHIDTYQSLTDHIPLQPEVFFKQLMDYISPVTSNYRDIWLEKDAVAAAAHKEYVLDLKWSDMSVFDAVLQSIPEGSDVQMGNSTPVRYIQLFNAFKSLHYFGNRGTSGIDGCVSTAVGAAISSRRLTTLIVGDMAFFYDTNGLWHQHVPSNLRIILINNGGGGIFRIIDGPSSVPELEEYFETRHNFTAENIALAYGLDYASCASMGEMKEQLPLLYVESTKAKILEIFTSNEENADVLSSYFKFIAERSIRS